MGHPTRLGDPLALRHSALALYSAAARRTCGLCCRGAAHLRVALPWRDALVRYPAMGWRTCEISCRGVAHLRLILPRGRRTGAISAKCAIFGRISHKCYRTYAIFCHFRLTCAILCLVGGKLAGYSASAPSHSGTSRKWGARARRPPDSWPRKALDRKLPAKAMRDALAEGAMTA